MKHKMIHFNNKFLEPILILIQVQLKLITLENNKRIQWVYKFNNKIGILYNPNDEVSLYYGDKRSFLFSLLPKY